MNSNSTVAEDALRREKSGLGNMIKTLAWEECRVGGVIAGWSLFIGLLCLVYCWWQLSGAAWNHNREIVLMFVAGAPMLTALSLILSTDYSGHLVGGFSQRILYLPVPVSAAVAVALGARIVFVFVTALVFTIVCRALFGDGPGIVMVPAIALLYLLAQTLDWLRKPLSGLSSLLIVALVLTFVMLLGRGEDVTHAVRGLTIDPAGLALLLCLAWAPVYGVAVVAVHATRVGRSIGIPELWEWPRFVSIPWLVRTKPFRSPLAAQVWFELRRSWWVLPGVVALFTLLLAGGEWLAMGPSHGLDAKKGLSGLFAPNDPYADLRLMSAFFAFVGILVGAAIHSGQTGLVLGRYAKPQPQFLHPLTSAQFAFSRIVSCAGILVSMIFAVLILQFALVGGRLVTEIMPDALAIGATSYREAFWVLLSRGLLVGLISWPLMNGGNRTITRMFLAELILGAALAWLHFKGIVDWQQTRILLPLVIIGITIGAYGHAWKTGVISLCAPIVAVGVWALATWVLLHAVLAAAPLTGLHFLWYASSFITCLGWASLIPLPYVGVALDVRRRRHAAAATQDPAQHVSAATPMFTGPARTAARVAAACVVLLFIWLGWPARPAYEGFLRARGYPATPDELNAWYPAVPVGENRALSYLDAAQKLKNAKTAFFARQAAATLDADDITRRGGIVGRSRAASSDADNLSDRLLITGNAKSKRGEPIAADVWNTRRPIGSPSLPPSRLS